MHSQSMAPSTRDERGGEAVADDAVGRQRQLVVAAGLEAKRLRQPPRGAVQVHARGYRESRASPGRRPGVVAARMQFNALPSRRRAESVGWGGRSCPPAILYARGPCPAPLRSTMRRPTRRRSCRCTARCSPSGASRRRRPRPTRRARSAASSTSIIGQEAVCVGAIAALQADDYVVATYREHGHAYAKGMPAPRRSWPSSTARRPAARRAWAARCTSSTRAATSSAATASSAATCRSRPASAFASQVPRRRPGHAVLLRRGRRPASAASTRASRWRRCGSCRSSSSARTTSTRWARRSTGRWRSRTCRMKALGYGMARDRFDGDDVITGQRPHRRGGRARARDRRADPGRGPHLPLPRPLDDRPGQVPHQGGGRGVEEARPGRHRAPSAARGAARARTGDRRDRGRGQGTRLPTRCSFAEESPAGRRVPARTFTYKE